MDNYGVVGNPIKHSKSPEIHQLFAKQVGHDILYHRIPATDESFTSVLEEFFKKGGKGLNITLPFKEKAFRFADSYSDNAQSCGSVNTLTFSEDGRAHGDNTDGIGLINDLKNNDVLLENIKVLILGAGGATRGIVPVLFKNNVGSIALHNRTVGKAELLQEEFMPFGKIESLSSDGLAGGFGLVVNATSANLDGVIPDIPDSVVSDAVCYDLAYSYGETSFLNWAKKNGSAKNLQGLGMLVEQAAESFYIWRGVRPRTSEVVDKLRSELLS
jgi:shikimate dehydrogenase